MNLFNFHTPKKSNIYNYLLVIVIFLSHDTFATTFCNSSFGIQRFFNGQQTVTLNTVNGQIHATFELMPNEEGYQQFRFPACVAPRLIVITAKSSDKLPLLFRSQALSEQFSFTEEIETELLFSTTDKKFWLIHFSESAIKHGLIPATFKNLINEKDIISVQPDMLISAQLAQQAQTSRKAPLINEYAPILKSIWMNTKGNNIRVAVIDDGFNLQHRDLNGAKIAPQSNSASSSGNLHGTKVAGLIFAQHNGLDINGIAPEATFIPVPIAGSYTSSLLQILNHVYQQKPDIINISWYLPWLMTPVKEAISFLAQDGRQNKGRAIFVASGNFDYSDSSRYSLAGMKEVMTIGAFHIRRKKPTRAQGKYIDIAAPVGFMSLATGEDHSQTIHTFIGSSAATPFISGISALLLSYCPRLTREQLYQLLISGADTPPHHLKQHLGAGVINLNRVWNTLVKQCPQPDN